MLVSDGNEAVVQIHYPSWFAISSCVVEAWVSFALVPSKSFSLSKKFLLYY